MKKLIIANLFFSCCWMEYW